MSVLRNGIGEGLLYIIGAAQLEADMGHLGEFIMDMSRLSCGLGRDQEEKGREGKQVQQPGAP